MKPHAMKPQSTPLVSILRVAAVCGIMLGPSSARCLAQLPSAQLPVVQLPDAVAQDEAARIATVAKITPATIAIFDGQAQSGGSGVIVTPDGYAVTNFHVVAPCGVVMKCGLPDGRLMDAVLVGIDPVGDVAVIKLFDKENLDSWPDEAAAWPTAEWGDSDQVNIGDEAIVAGNPFLLANDFQPTITHGIISGTHRYQYPAGTLLEYADCLQTDAAINPGNSGGPLYDGSGKLIGINGRGSFEKRGRVNVGVGYAISSNQVQRFLSHLRSGRIVDHATLDATVRTASGGRVVVDQIRSSSDAYRRGLRFGDQIIRAGGREIRSANALQNAIGTYPPGWRLPITFRRGYQTKSIDVRLQRIHGAAQLEKLVGGQVAPPSIKPPQDKLPKKILEIPTKKVAKHRLFEDRPGFANYHFNRIERDALLHRCPQRGQSPDASLPWTIEGQAIASGDVTIELGQEKARFVSQRGRFWVDLETSLHDQLGPPGSGGLLAALHIWRQTLAGKPARGLEYVGLLRWNRSGGLCECLAIDQQGMLAELFFDSATHDLIGIEVAPSMAVDRCRVEFSEFHLGPDGVLPGRMMVSYGDDPWLEFEVESYRTDEPNSELEAPAPESTTPVQPESGRASAELSP